MAPAPTLDALVHGLRQFLPADAVLHQPAQLLVYDCDAYTIEKAPPTVVVLPASTAEVQQVMRFAHAHGLAVVPRGAGTGLSGGSLAEHGGIMVGLSRMNKVVAIDLANRRAVVEAGLVNLKLSEAVAGADLHFAPDPSSQSACTIGGNVAENAGGPHTLKYGVTVNHVLAVELVMHDGEAIWIGGDADEAPGFDLLGAVVGAEGTFGIVTQAIVRLVPRPAAVRTMLSVFPSVEAASAAVSAVIGAGMIPAALEFMDQTIIQAVEAAFQLGLPTDAAAVLIVELDGLEAGIDAEAEAVAALLRAHGAYEIRQASDPAERARLWLARKKAVGAVGRLAPSKVTMDGVIPRTKLPGVLAAINEVATRHGIRVANVFHAGDGNLHPIILFDERDEAQTRRVVAAGGEILDICLAAGGSITGEHGVGVEKRDHMDRQFGPNDLAAMQRLRAIFDPDARMNPDKLFPSRRGCGEVGVAPGRGGLTGGLMC